MNKRNNTLNKTKVKAKVFAKEYVSNGFNGTQAVKKILNPKDRHTASSMATEYLNKPAYKEAITKRIDELLMEDDTNIEKIHKRNITQDSNIPASNQALDMYHKLGGDYAPEKKINLNANINTNNIDKRLKEIQHELSRLQPQA